MAHNNLIWLSTPVSHWTFPLAGVGDVVEVVHLAWRSKDRKEAVSNTWGVVATKPKPTMTYYTVHFMMFYGNCYGNELI